MVNRIKKLFNKWRANIQLRRELHQNLENLIDPTFIARAIHRERNGK